MTQIGNISSLFRHKEKSQIEEVAVQLLGMIDEEKTNALLGRTYKKTESGIDRWAIVRKRIASIAIDNSTHTIILSSRTNLAESKETGTDIYEPEVIAKKWGLPEMQAMLYECLPGDTQATKLQSGGLDVDNIHIIFSAEDVTY